MSTSVVPVEYFKEYCDDTFLSFFETVEDENNILFIIAKNKDEKKFLVMTNEYSDNAPMKEYIKVWKTNEKISKSMEGKIRRLNYRHDIIHALYEQNPNVPVRMNPFAPTNLDDFNILVKSMYLTWSYYVSTVKSFHSNRIFLVNYVDDEWPCFIYEDRCMFAGSDKPKNVPYFEGCKDCKSSSTKDGCSEVRKWFDEVFKGILEENDTLPILECSNECSCFKNKIICKNRVSYKNRDNTPLVIFKTLEKGWALAAGKDIKADELVTEYAGVIYDDFETMKTSDSTYTFNMDYMRQMFEYKHGQNFRRDNHYYLIDSIQFGNEARFANHSCDPNMKIVVSYGTYKSPTYHKVFYFAKKNILMGTELTVSYFHVPGEKTSNSLRCKCGANDCMEILPITQKNKS